MKKLVVLFIVVGAGVISLGSAVLAEEPGAEPQIKYMPRGATSGDLVEVLRPKTRGIGQVAATEEPAQPVCEKYQPGGGTTRGVAPVSDYAAIEILFEFNSADLTPEAEKTLTQLGKALTSDELKRYCFVIEGHTDDVGGDSYNQRLSEHRAQSAAAYLTSNFKIDKTRLVTVGFGEAKPMDSNATDEGRHKNRRVQVANVGQ